MVVNVSRPASPNTASSHTSLAFSVSGSLSASAAWRASGSSRVRFSRPRPRVSAPRRASRPARGAGPPDQPQHLHAGVRSGPGALLQPVEHLGGDQRWHAGQAHLAGDHDRGGGAPPAGLVAPGVGPAGRSTGSGAVRSRRRVRPERSRGQAATRQGPNRGRARSAAAANSPTGTPAQHLARPVRAAQPVRARRPRAARHHTARHACRRPGRAGCGVPQPRMIR